MQRIVSGHTCLLIALASLFGAQLAQAEFEFGRNDHVAIVGNALPDRMQHEGWLETYLQSTNPKNRLVIRNLGFTGDRVAHRPRNSNFMTPEETLALIEADTLLVFFGYNESFDHDPEKFKGELSRYIERIRAEKFNGEGSPRIVLFSPIAHEDLGSPNFPDGKENTLWLSIYTDAMARVADAEGVPFVDLFALSKKLYEAHDEPLTINGVHLNAAGNKAVARAIVETLQGEVQEEGVDLIRAAVLEKNWCWFNRYRATDGNDVWGGRSTLKFVDDQTNAEVLQHELVMLDIMTANRDEVIWQANKGKSIAPDDSNVPDPVQVQTNYQPSEKNGALEFVPADKGVETLTLAQGMKANLFASEEMFPELINPVQMDVDTQGRIWVAAWETYPKWQPDQEMLDRLIILPDENRDGVADEAITFAFVHNPTGFTFWNGGVIVASAPNIWFLKDTDGDDKADSREILFSGLDSADTHHSANGFDYGPGGYVYYQRGVFHVSNVETPWMAPYESGATGMYRFNPRTHRYSFHADNSPNPHGGDFDYWGYHYATDATSGEAFQVRQETDGTFKMHKLLEKTVRPVASSGILSSTHFPEENNGNFIILNTIGFLGIKQYKLENTDGVVWGTETEDLLVSSDGNFRPSDFKVGDDGALYVADWANPLIGHMQHNVRDPSRDHEHGRVYRITVAGRPLEEHVNIDGEPIEALLEVLKHPTNGVRLRARIELSERNTDEVIAAAQKWIMQFDGSKVEDAHPLVEALWLHQQHDVVNEGLLTMLLFSPEPHARRAAERVKYLWEIEGKMNVDETSAMNHMAMMAMRGPGMGEDYLKQDKSPAPKMEGDTMVIHIQTLKEQMKYDLSKFAVGPGMKVRIEFSNPDAMDHNLMIVEPGAAAQVAWAAERLGAEGTKKNWRPESDKILVASKLLSRGKSETIEFTAPTVLGEYDYICTFPGHWMLMRGLMVVVEDVQAWMKANPDNSVSGAGGRAFVREWKPEDLLKDIDKIAKGRSLERGAEIFTAATCIGCHTKEEDGGVVGPNLAEVSARLDPTAMLTELLEPSKVIKEEYKPVFIELDSFEDVYGLVAEDTTDYLRVITDPLKDKVGRKIMKDEISRMTPSEISTMPTGLLNTYNRDEILDLIAYIRSGEKAAN